MANPLDAVAYNNLGNVFAKRGDVDRAIGAYKEAIRVRSDYATAYNNLGDQYAFRLDDFGTGKAFFEAALKYEPDFVMGIHNLGTVLMGRGETAAAKGKFERVMELDESFVPTMGNLVAIYIEEGKREEAREMVRRMEEILPGDDRVKELRRKAEALGK
jgi:protein O-GlcNAc transferase